MYSISEPRRATVSCKNLSVSSTKNDRSIPPSSSRRHFNNNSNIKRNNNKNNTSFIRSSNHSSKSQRKFIDKNVENLSNSNVFHIPFCVEQTNDNLRKNLIKNNNNKLLRTRLNPLSPVFYSTRQNSLLLEQKENILSSNVHIPILSETSDYSSGTDLELQSTKQNISPQNDSSPFTFDFDERTFSFSIEDINNPISSSMRRMCSSLSLSSLSSSSTSPSSSISNLSSLSSSSECQGNFNNQNRLSNKKILSVNNNKSHNESNDVHNCHCEKLNLSNRKRNRLNSYPIRRLTTIDYCENCQLKRMKFNTRTKYCSNRQQKQRIDNNNNNNNNRYCSTELAPVKFSVDLTGLNVNFTIDYHDSIPCTCSTTVMPYSITNSFNESNNNEFLYYIDTDNHSSWIEQTSPIFNYHDLYFTKLNHTNHISSIYFDDNAIIEAIPTVPSYYVRYMLPSIEIESIQPPPTRSWLRLASPNATRPTAIFTVMNYNILCDKYATRHVYGYCPSWALKWEYRRKQIFDEIRSYSADIIALQEIETDQFNQYFLPELQKLGYDGVFSPKSRAKTMCEQDRRFVDGCAIFYRQSKFRLIKDYLVEFNQLAMLAANGPACHDIMNRVMTKDNISLVALLETKEEIYSHSFSNGTLPADHKQLVFVCTAHIHWDPEYSDVKVIQTLMLFSELKTIMEDTMKKYRKNTNGPIDCTSAPLVLCGDFNSLPDSGVIEFMRNGKISMNHADFRDLSYQSYLQKMTGTDADSGKNPDITHHFKLQSAYETTSSPIMPYTNYTYDFKGIIDYVFFSAQLMRVLGVLGPLDPEWLQSNKIVGCPHPNVPSDHFPLLVEFELDPAISDTASNNNGKTTLTPKSTRRQ